VEAFGHVGAGFRKTERAEQASASDTLLERLKFGSLENGEKFGLAAENDLKELFLIRVGIAEQSNFFEEFDAHQMSFVDEQDGGATLLLRLEKHLVKSGEAARLAGGGAADFVFFENGLEKFRWSESRVDEKRGDEAAAAFGFFGENLEGGVKESRFSGADGASDDGETLALENALEKNFERSTMRVGQMQESGIRRQAKRFFFKLIKGRIQIDLPWSQPLQQKPKRSDPLNEQVSYQTANSITNTDNRG
jgi:hypothetical protein